MKSRRSDQPYGTGQLAAFNATGIDALQLKITDPEAPEIARRTKKKNQDDLLRLCSETRTERRLAPGEAEASGWSRRALIRRSE